MLKTTKKITINGKSIIDNIEVCGYQAQIDESYPTNMSLSDWQINKELYKANRVECRADLAEFEDYAYTIQDELIAALEEEKQTEVTTN